MTSFVVETYVPAESAEHFAIDVNGLRNAAAAAGDRVRHIRSYLVPGDEMGFHLVEAVTAADVANLARRAGIEPERIVVALGIDGDGANGPAADTDGPGYESVMPEMRQEGVP